MAAIGGILLVMNSLAASKNTAAAPLQVSPTPAPAKKDEIVATVNGQDITKSVWNKATRLDAVMNQLTGQPMATAEETLDRLVNEILALAAAPNVAPPSTADAEARTLTLEQQWRVGDEAVIAALDKIGLTRDDLTGRVSRLIQVEAALSQLAAQNQDMNAWLTQARASAKIGLYYPLAETRPAAAPPPISPTVLAAPVAEVNFAPPPEMPTAPYEQNAAPDFTLSPLNGEPLTLSSLRGKPVLVNFWASWCPPCKQELPALQAAYTRYGDKLGFVAVNVKEDPAAVDSFIKEQGLTFPIVFDPDGQVSDGRYEVRGIPTTIFVDAYGVVAARHVGPLDEAAIDGYLMPLLAERRRAESGENAAAALLTSDTVISAPAANVSAPTPTTALPLAPEFNLTAAGGQTVSLADYRDKSAVVLVFYRGQT